MEWQARSPLSLMFFILCFAIKCHLQDVSHFHLLPLHNCLFSYLQALCSRLRFYHYYLESLIQIGSDDWDWLHSFNGLKWPLVHSFEYQSLVKKAVNRMRFFQNRFIRLVGWKNDDEPCTALIGRWKDTRTGVFVIACKGFIIFIIHICISFLLIY